MKITRITAMWCTSCLLMKSRWKKVFKDYSDIEITDFDFDEDETIVKELNPGRILPVLIIYKNGKEVSRIIGEKSKKQLAKLLEELQDETG